MNDKNCGKWCKEVSTHLKNLYRTRKQKIQRSNKAPQQKIKESKMLAKRVSEAHRLIKETPITDRERDIVASYIKKHDSDEKKFGYNYEEDFDKVQTSLCWKEAEHLEEILFTSLFQLKFKDQKEREEAIRANTHSLKTLSDACKEIEKTEKSSNESVQKRQKRNKRGQEPKRRNNESDDEEDQDEQKPRQRNNRRSNKDEEDDEEIEQKDPRTKNKSNDDNEIDEEDDQPKQRPQRSNKNKGGDDFEDDEEKDEQNPKRKEQKKNNNWGAEEDNQDDESQYLLI